MNAFKCVLFDFDGTLARTMEDHFEAWKVALAEYDVALCPEDYFPLEGTSVHELARMFAQRSSRPIFDSKEIVRKKEELYLRNHRFELYPGVEELIDALKRKEVPIGIVTAALHERLIKSTPAEFLGKFDVIVTGERTARGKPHPDPYLEGAKQLGVAASECVVVENSPLGVRAAKSANAYCIAICSTMTPDHLVKADQVIDSFELLSEVSVIRQLIA